MDPEAFCRQSRTVLVVGKGGVGKTTCSAALALMAARLGLRSLVVQLDDAGGLGAMFGHPGPIGFEPVELWREQGGPGLLSARVLLGDAALLEYLGEHGMGRIARRLEHSGALEVVASAIPGIRELLVLAKLKQIERDASEDLVVVDAPATGHALSFLTSPGGLQEISRAGPLRRQADEVAALLADGSRCQVLLVTIPEETPVNEVIESAFRLEDEVGVALRAVVVNGCGHGTATEPDLGAALDRAAGGLAPGELEALRNALERARTFREERARLERQAISRLVEELPLPQLHLPAVTSPDDEQQLLVALADALEQAVRES
jgi:anion-transporting  ArsA/GET3 family ATPase